MSNRIEITTGFYESVFTLSHDIPNKNITNKSSSEKDEFPIYYWKYDYRKKILKTGTISFQCLPLQNCGLIYI